MFVWNKYWCIWNLYCYQRKLKYSPFIWFWLMIVLFWMNSQSQSRRKQKNELKNISNVFLEQLKWYYHHQHSFHFDDHNNNNYIVKKKITKTINVIIIIIIEIYCMFCCFFVFWLFVCITDWLTPPSPPLSLIYFLKTKIYQIEIDWIQFIIRYPTNNNNTCTFLNI